MAWKKSWNVLSLIKKKYSNWSYVEYFVYLTGFERIEQVVVFQKGVTY